MLRRTRPSPTPTTRPSPVGWSRAGAVAAAAGAAVLALATAAPAAATGTPTGEPPEVPGLVVYASDTDVDATAQAVQDALSANGMVTAVLDHQENAASVGMELRPTTLVVGGAPPVGTPLLQASQRAGVDLPQKFLAWEDEAGDVWLGYNSAEHVAVQAGLPADDPTTEALATASATIAAAASGSEEPATEGAPVEELDGYLADRPSDAADVDAAIARYQEATTSAGLSQVALVDHAAAAASIGEVLRPTQVLLAGNPAAGTPLIQAAQTMGIDLPTRYLAWEDESGQVRVGNVDVGALARRHGVEDVSTLAMVRQATAGFTAAAAGGMVAPEGGVDTGAGGAVGGVDDASWLLPAGLALLAAGGAVLVARRRVG
ncbi:DUF302 domain-containing protein [Pseudokineococcus basanitobsidens]|uniref:DUF302 domain-containing protein n=1 Tax=Pseudokineococcus basanitobsidens TaxID=1926649 RepID=A0ABU8RL84_9ACTN